MKEQASEELREGIAPTALRDLPSLGPVDADVTARNAASGGFSYHERSAVSTRGLIGHFRYRPKAAVVVRLGKTAPLLLEGTRHGFS